MLFRHTSGVPTDSVNQLTSWPVTPGWAGAGAAAGALSRTRRREAAGELWRLAGTMCRVSPLYFDLTFSLSKSLSLFHASLGENVRRARQDDNGDAAAFWTAELAAMDAMIYAANEALLAFFQREAGYTRTGSHAARVNGRETGQWHEADLAVASWLQHTSRDGDPQLHVHNQILHAARTRRDGKWRAPDSFGYSEHAGAAAAIGTAHLEAAMTRRWGLAWAPRADGYGSEIKGISAALMEEFSSRRATIKARVARMARDYEDEHGRAPSQAQLAKMAQRANLATRKGKEHGAFNAAQLHEGWAARLAARRDPELSDVELRGIAPRVSNLGEGGAAAQTAPGPDDPAPGKDSAREEEARAAQTALATLARKKSTWTRSDLIQHLWWALPGKTRRMDPLFFCLALVSPNLPSPQISPVSANSTGIRIMPLGDSITYGEGSSTLGGYRLQLWKDLRARRFPIDFVGSVQTGPASFDRDNEGHPGWKINQIAAKVVNWLITYRPNIILLHIGTNDFVKNDDPARAQERLSHLLNLITTTLPGVTVIVAKRILPLPRSGRLNGEVVAYNAAIPGIVQADVAQGKHVHYVDIYDAVPLSMLNKIHPNDAGYALMAKVWLYALLPILGRSNLG